MNVMHCIFYLKLWLKYVVQYFFKIFAGTRTNMDMNTRQIFIQQVLTSLEGIKENLLITPEDENKRDSIREACLNVQIITSDKFYINDLKHDIKMSST